MDRRDDAVAQCAEIQRLVERLAEAAAHCDTALAKVPDLTGDFLISGRTALRWDFDDAMLDSGGGIEGDADGMVYLHEGGYVLVRLQSYAEQLVEAIKLAPQAPNAKSQP